MKATSMKLAISLLLVVLTSTVAHAEPVSSLSSAADEAARQVAEACKPVEGKVLSILPEKQFLLDITAANGAYVGMEMEVFRAGEPFKHPVTGETLGRMDRPVGTVRLTAIQEKFSIAEPIRLEPGEQVRQGDGVRVTAARLLMGLANVTASAGYEGVAQRARRDLEIALSRTGRFEVIDERRMRSALIKGGFKEDVQLRNPDALKFLQKDLRISVVALPHISEAGGTLVWDVPIVSPVSGNLLRSVSVEVASSPIAKTPAGDSAPAPTPPKAPHVATSEATPSPAWIGPPSQRSSEFLAVPYAGIPSARLTLGPDFEAPIRGIAVADFDGDGKKEVAVAEPGRIHIFAVEGQKFRLLWSSQGHELERWSEILAIDAADINGNGVPEIFVTSYYADSVNSYVLERQGDNWVLTFRDLDLFFRVLPDRQGRPTLYAQEKGAGKAFTGPPRVYRWRDGRYEPSGELRLPRGTYIYNFAVGDVRNDGGTDALQISNREHRLRVFSGGKLRSELPERIGGSDVFFDWQNSDQKQMTMAPTFEFDDTIERYIVHPPLLITDLDGDGKMELVTVRNMASMGYLMKRLVIYDKSRIVALRWGGAAWQMLWETQELEGYVSGFFLGDLGDGGDPVLMFALVQPQKLGLAGARGGLFVFRLTPPPVQTEARGSQ